MMALVLVGLMFALVIVSILGWTADSRDDAHKLWPLEGAQRDSASTVPKRDDHGMRDARPDAALAWAGEEVSRPTAGKSP